MASYDVTVNVTWVTKGHSSNSFRLWCYHLMQSCPNLKIGDYSGQAPGNTMKICPLVRMMYPPCKKMYTKSFGSNSVHISFVLCVLWVHHTFESPLQFLGIHYDHQVLLNFAYMHYVCASRVLMFHEEGCELPVTYGL